MKYSNDVAMTWKMKWLNRSVATINAMLQLLDIYRFTLFLILIIEFQYVSKSNKESEEVPMEVVEIWWS